MLLYSAQKVTEAGRGGLERLLSPTGKRFSTTEIQWQQKKQEPKSRQIWITFVAMRSKYVCFLCSLRWCTQFVRGT